MGLHSLGGTPVADLLRLASDVSPAVKAGWIMWLVWAAVQVWWYRMSRESEPAFDLETPTPSWKPEPPGVDAPSSTLAADDVAPAREVSVEPSLAAVLTSSGTRAPKRRRRMSPTTSPTAA